MGGSLDDVVVGVVVCWVAGGATPGGGEDAGVAEVFVVGVVGGGDCRLGLVSLLRLDLGRLCLGPGGREGLVFSCGGF